MSVRAEIPILERPAFFNGQQLTAADLEAVHTFHRDLHWLHNRSLHNWGIASGYAVSGQRGARTVEVQPGYALDCEGRELILRTTETMPIPAVAGADSGGPAEYYLTASYADAEALSQEEEMRQGACGTAGAVRRPERPILDWKSPSGGSEGGAYRHGMDVVLAAIKVQNCQLAEDLSTSERRDALPPRRPYVAAGQTPEGSTVWKAFPKSDGDDQQRILGVWTMVDTTEARFHTTPRYQAHVIGKRTYDFLRDDEPFTALIEGYPYIEEPTASSFRLRVLLPTVDLADQDQRLLVNPRVELHDPNVDFTKRLRCRPGDPACVDGEGLGWHVVWVGVE